MNSIGAVYGMERMMGRANNPLRRILNYASTHFTDKLPLLYALTVIGFYKDGQNVCRGIFVGDGGYRVCVRQSMSEVTDRSDSHFSF